MPCKAASNTVVREDVSCKSSWWRPNSHVVRIYVSEVGLQVSSYLPLRSGTFVFKTLDWKILVLKKELFSPINSVTS